MLAEKVASAPEAPPPYVGQNYQFVDAKGHPIIQEQPQPILQPQPGQPIVQGQPVVQGQSLPLPSVYYPTSPQFVSPDPMAQYHSFSNITAPTIKAAQPSFNESTIKDASNEKSNGINIIITNSNNDSNKKEKEEEKEDEVIVSNGPIPRNPTGLYCHRCKKNVYSVIDFENNGLVWLLSLFLFLFTCCLFMIPFYINDLKDVVHYCPRCKSEIGRNSKFGVEPVPVIL